MLGTHASRRPAVCPPHRLVFVDRVVGVTSTPHLFQFETPCRKEVTNDLPPVVVPFSFSPRRVLAARELRDGGDRGNRCRGRLAPIDRGGSVLVLLDLVSPHTILRSSFSGAVMRSLFKSFLRNSCSTVAVLGIAAGSASAGDVSPSFTGDSVVGDLAQMNDLEPLAEIAAMQRHEQSAIPTYARATSASADTHLRASVPVANRSQSLFVGGDVFANSAAVLPLLVGDMGPAVSPVSRPMSGRLVGARPSLPLTRLPLVKRSAE